jgi:sirohydrochlorin cobaltochelatase
MRLNDSKTGVLLISHGSRLPYGSEVINRLADMYKEIVDYKIGIGYMEMHKPDIATAIDELTEGTDIERVIAVPVFLAHGVHTKKDIPEILGLNINETNLNEDDSQKHDHSHDHGDHSRQGHNHAHKSHNNDHEHHNHEQNHDHKHSHSNGNHTKHIHDHKHSHSNGNHTEHIHEHENSKKINFSGEIIYTDPLGADPLVLEIIKKRVFNAIKK